MRRRSGIMAGGVAFAALWGAPAAGAGGGGGESSPVLVAAVFYDGRAPSDLDEAVQVWNVGPAAVDLSGWTVGDGEGSAGFPVGVSLAAGEHWWLAREPGAFRDTFGRAPEWSWGGGGSHGTLLAARGGPRLADPGDEVVLRRRDGAVADVAVWGRGRWPGAGWIGPPVAPYFARGLPKAHQVLYRKLDPATARPVPDTDRLQDWAGDPGDPALGRRVRYPGWGLERRLQTQRFRGAGALEAAVAPEALFDFLFRHVTAARRSIDWLAYTFDHPGLAEALAERAAAGVRVRLLLDGSPAGGFDGNARWSAHRVASAGGEVYWMGGAGTGARFRAAHAKLMVVDGRLVVIATENPTLASAPRDDLSDGTRGRRGVALATDVPAVVAWAQEVVAQDLTPERRDVRRYQPRDFRRGAPAPGFRPQLLGGGTGYAPVAPRPIGLRGTWSFEVMTAPGNALAPGAGLLGLVAQARAGDEVLVEEMDEPLWWGLGSPAGRYPNPRVAAYLSAARRGSTVRVLLDSFFDDPTATASNRRTVAALNRAAAAEGLDLAARLGNPTGLGLHAKVVLVRLGGIAGAAWTHLGSLNGTEAASKANREVALQVSSPGLHAFLARVFAADWSQGGFGAAYLPQLAR